MTALLFRDPEGARTCPEVQSNLEMRPLATRVATELVLFGLGFLNLHSLRLVTVGLTRLWTVGLLTR